MRRIVFRVVALALAALTLLALTACAEEASGWKNILLLGGDARTAEGYDRSDSMIILSVNRDEAQVKMTSILRDTWVHFPGRTAPGKINAATVYGGAELAVATVNSCFGTDIEDYVIVNMTDMRDIIDLLGGVDVELTAAEAGYLKLGGAGRWHLDGENAVTFCRIRSIDSDYMRVMRQQRVLLAMAERAQDMELGELSAMADDILEIVMTSLDDEELAELVRAFMVMDVEVAAQYRVPADGTFAAGMRGGVWRIDADFEQNAELLRRFIYGE